TSGHAKAGRHDLAKNDISHVRVLRAVHALRLARTAPQLPPLLLPLRQRDRPTHPALAMGPLR
ncbi:unnamed protein product, partial [Closterium sp. NIES-65]